MISFEPAALIFPTSQKEFAMTPATSFSDHSTSAKVHQHFYKTLIAFYNTEIFLLGD